VNPLRERALLQIRSATDADWAALSELYAEDVAYRDPDVTLTGRDRVVDRLRGQVDAMPGCTATVHRAFDDQDAVVLEWTLLAPTGDDTPIRLDVVTAYEFRDGLISAERNYWDNAGLLAQLGAEGS
jgi:steroid delta-isomerase-like uncharacterized protein